jgi:hypothetical protein
MLLSSGVARNAAAPAAALACPARFPLLTRTPGPPALPACRSGSQQILARLQPFGYSVARSYRQVVRPADRPVGNPTKARSPFDSRR